MDSRTCFACGADLRNLPPEQRRYLLGPPEPVAVVLTHPETAYEPIPEAAEVELVASHPETMMPKASLPESGDLSLCEALDRILNKGAALLGEVIISVADIDLVYLGLQVILASMETARGFNPGLGEGQSARLENRITLRDEWSGIQARPGSVQLAPNLFDKGACR